MQIKLASYNIQYGVGKDERHDLGRIAAEIGDADIVALQEVERGNPLRDLVDQPAELARLIGLEHTAFGPGFDLHLDESLTGGRKGLRQAFGNMILSRWPILSITNHVLPKVALHGTLHLQRTLMEAVIATPAGPLRFLSTHLDHASPLNRLPQCQALRAIMCEAEKRGGPWGGVEPGASGFGHAPPPFPRDAIVMGDMNFTWDGPEYTYLMGDISPMLGRRVSPAEGLFDAWTLTGHGEAEGWTFVKEGRPPMRLDHCFVTPGHIPAVKAMWIDEDATGSDHQPIFVTLDLAA